MSDGYELAGAQAAADAGGRLHAQIEESLFPKNDFPILGRSMRGGSPLVYLDSAATAQKPQQVIDAVVYQELYLNGAVSRGSHELAEASTLAMEDARAKVAHFIGAQPDEISWTKNSTEALNEIAYALGNIACGRGESVKGWQAHSELAERLTIKPGDNIVATRAEHHANIVPWQELCARTGAEFRWLELTADGRIDLSSAQGIIDTRTKVVAFTHVSNVTGALSPVTSLVNLTRTLTSTPDTPSGALIVLDSCQSIAHSPLDVKALDIDFAVLSGHKLYGPTGIGALYGRRELLATLPPFMGGGSMIEIVRMEGSTYANAPARFEAGSQPVAQAVGLGAAIDYVSAIGMDAISRYEHELTAYLLPRLQEIPGVRVLGPEDLHERLGVVAFDVEDVHPHDVGQVLDQAGVAVRVGHHCAQPIHHHFGVWASSRVSLAPYNTRRDIDVFLEALSSVRAFFALERRE